MRTLSTVTNTIGHLTKPRAATDFHDLWGGMTNDEAFDFGRYFLKVTGVELGNMFELGTSDDWTNVQPVVNSMIEFVSVANRELGHLNARGGDDVYSPFCHRVLGDPVLATNDFAVPIAAVLAREIRGAYRNGSRVSDRLGPKQLICIDDDHLGSVSGYEPQ